MFRTEVNPNGYSLQSSIEEFDWELGQRDMPTILSIASHDLRGLTSLAKGYIDTLLSLSSEAQLDPIAIQYRSVTNGLTGRSQPHDHENEIAKLVSMTSATLDFLREANIQSGSFLGQPSEEADAIRILVDYKQRVTAINKLLPLVAKSLWFIFAPDLVSYHRLRNNRISLSEINQAIGAECEMDQDLRVNGFTAILYLNGLMNAWRHQKLYFQTSSEIPPMPLSVSVNDAWISIGNLSRDPIPDQATELGIKGEGGSTGMGLFIVRQFAQVAGIHGFRLKSWPLSNSQGWFTEFSISTRCG